MFYSLLNNIPLLLSLTAKAVSLPLNINVKTSELSEIEGQGDQSTVDLNAVQLISIETRRVKITFAPLPTSFTRSDSPQEPKWQQPPVLVTGISSFTLGEEQAMSTSLPSIGALPTATLPSTASTLAPRRASPLSVQTSAVPHQVYTPVPSHITHCSWATCPLSSGNPISTIMLPIPTKIDPKCNIQGYASTILHQNYLLRDCYAANVLTCQLSCFQTALCQSYSFQQLESAAAANGTRNCFFYSGIFDAKDLFVIPNPMSTIRFSDKYPMDGSNFCYGNRTL